MKPIFTLLLMVWICVHVHAQSSATVPAGYRGEVIAQIDAMEKKFTDLAKAFPADKWTWRPADGVRSANEVVNHVAGANYFLAQFLGVKPDMELRPDAEKEKDIEKTLAFIKTSFSFARKMVSDIPDQELDKKVKFFGGQESTARNVLLVTVSHMHEHLGQLIAYARMNGVVPPWSKGKSE